MLQIKSITKANFMFILLSDFTETYCLVLMLVMLLLLIIAAAFCFMLMKQKEDIEKRESDFQYFSNSFLYQSPNTHKMKTDGYIQIDVDQINKEKQVAKCTLWTPEGSVVIYMKESDYEYLNRNNFFVRSSDENNTDGLVNTSLPYYQKSEL